jgi:flagellin-like protein
MVGRKDAGVSPVVGTMMLLAVVVILAALLAAYAGGAVGGETKVTPNAELVVYPAGEGEKFTLVFEHRGGENIRTRDLKINTWIHLPDGNMRAATHTLASNPSTVAGVRLPAVPGHDGDLPADEEFGVAIWRPGTVAITGDGRATAEFLGLTRNELEECVGGEAVLEVKIFHVPSGNVLHGSKMVLRRE